MSNPCVQDLHAFLTLIKTTERNIWERRSDSFTQVRTLRLGRQIFRSNERRQGYSFPLSPHILQSFCEMETELIPHLSGLCFISKQLSD